MGTYLTGDNTGVWTTLKILSTFRFVSPIKLQRWGDFLLKRNFTGSIYGQTTHVPGSNVNVSHDGASAVNFSTHLVTTWTKEEGSKADWDVSSSFRRKKSRQKRKKKKITSFLHNKRIQATTKKSQLGQFVYVCAWVHVRDAWGCASQHTKPAFIRLLDFRPAGPPHTQEKCEIHLFTLESVWQHRVAAASILTDRLRNCCNSQRRLWGGRLDWVAAKGPRSRDGHKEQLPAPYIRGKVENYSSSVIFAPCEPSRGSTLPLKNVKLALIKVWRTVRLFFCCCKREKTALKEDFQVSGSNFKDRPHSTVTRWTHHLSFFFFQGELNQRLSSRDWTDSSPQSAHQSSPHGRKPPQAHVDDWMERVKIWPGKARESLHYLRIT